MSGTWLITGISKEKPRIGPLGEYNGEDVYHPNQPTHGQIDEALVQFTDKPVIVIVIDPAGCDSPEEVAEAAKNTVKWTFEKRESDRKLFPRIAKKGKRSGKNGLQRN
jgi:hypothetical protein